MDGDKPPNPVNTDEARLPSLVMALAGRANGIDTPGKSDDDVSAEVLNDGKAPNTGGKGILVVVVETENGRG